MDHISKTCRRYIFIPTQPNSPLPRAEFDQRVSFPLQAQGGQPQKRKHLIYPLVFHSLHILEPCICKLKPDKANV